MSAPLWTLDAMAQAMAARRQGALPASVSGLSIDSRTLGAGDAFFAITGDSRDGHEFVPGALKAGAGLAVVERPERQVRWVRRGRRRDRRYRPDQVLAALIPVAGPAEGVRAAACHRVDAAARRHQTNTGSRGTPLCLG